MGLVGQSEILSQTGKPRGCRPQVLTKVHVERRIELDK